MAGETTLRSWKISHTGDGNLTEEGGYAGMEVARGRNLYQQNTQRKPQK